MNILFVGGGSGGHFYPCIEFIKYCQNLNDNCFYIGGINKYEEKKKNLIPCTYKFYEFNGFNNTLKSGVNLIKSYYEEMQSNNKIKRIIAVGTNHAGGQMDIDTDLIKMKQLLMLLFL